MQRIKFFLKDLKGDCFYNKSFPYCGFPNLVGTERISNYANLTEGPKMSTDLYPPLVEKIWRFHLDVHM